MYMSKMKKHAGYMTGVVAGVLLSLLLVTSIAMAEVEVLELTRVEAIEVLNDRIPNAHMTGEYNVGRFMIGHTIAYTLPHSFAPVFGNEKVTFLLAKNQTEGGCALLAAVVVIRGQEKAEPFRVGICYNGVIVRLYFEES